MQETRGTSACTSETIKNFQKRIKKWKPPFFIEGKKKLAKRIFQTDARFFVEVIVNDIFSRFENVFDRNAILFGFRKSSPVMIKYVYNLQNGK